MARASKTRRPADLNTRAFDILQIAGGVTAEVVQREPPETRSSFKLHQYPLSSTQPLA